MDINNVFDLRERGGLSQNEGIQEPYHFICELGLASHAIKRAQTAP